MSRTPQPRLVELRDVRLSLARKPVLRGVSWMVCRGEGWLVTGANGAGKTSLLRILAGRTWPDPGPRGGTRRYFFGKTPTESPIGIEGRMAWLSPEMHQRYARLDAPLTAGDAILAGFANTIFLTHRPSPAQRVAARALAAKLDVAKFWRCPFIELSQGQQRLVLLARALVAKPLLLVLDEFSDGLDRANRTRLAVEIGRRLCIGAAVVVATHRAEDVLPGLTRHLILNRGQAVETPISPAVTKSSKSRRIGPKIIRPKSNDSPMLEFSHASVSVGDHQRVKRILHQINWTVFPGEHWAVLGANGSGKSTLLRTIYGELTVARGGFLRRFGKNETELPLPQARRRMGWVSPTLQHHYNADASVLEVVASGFQSTIGLLRPPTRVELTRAKTAFGGLGLSQLARRRWGALSFGESRLVLLARALAPQPQLLLLDEPCDSLAPAMRAKFLRLVDRAMRTGAQIIITAHHATDLPACINRTLRLHNGRVI